LFAADATYANLARRLAAGYVIKATPLTDKFGIDDFKEHYGADALPLFLTENGRLTPFSVERTPDPAAGKTVIALVAPTEPAASASRRS
jgi:hypothetical protein